MKFRSTRWGATAVLALGLAACGNPNSSTSANTSTASTGTTPTPTAASPINEDNLPQQAKNLLNASSSQKAINNAAAAGCGLDAIETDIQNICNDVENGQDPSNDIAQLQTDLSNLAACACAGLGLDPNSFGAIPDPNSLGGLGPVGAGGGAGNPNIPGFGNIPGVP